MSLQDGRKVTPRDVSWLAGLLEGEGSFGYTLCRSRAVGPYIKVSITDRDVVERAAGLLGVGVHFEKLTRTGKPMWLARVAGPRARGWMMTLYAEMGRRRREKIRESLRQWRDLNHVNARYVQACRLGHPLDAVHGIKRPTRYCRVCATESSRRSRATVRLRRGTVKGRNPIDGRWIAVPATESA